MACLHPQDTWKINSVLFQSCLHRTVGGAGGSDGRFTPVRAQFTIRGHRSPSRYPRGTKEILNTSCFAEQSRNLTEKDKEKSHYVRTALAAARVPDAAPKSCLGFLKF